MSDFVVEITKNSVIVEKLLVSARHSPVNWYKSKQLGEKAFFTLNISQFFKQNLGDLFRVQKMLFHNSFSCFFSLDQYRGEHVAEIDIFGNCMQTPCAVHLNLKVSNICYDYTCQDMDDVKGSNTPYQENGTGSGISVSLEL